MKGKFLGLAFVAGSVLAGCAGQYSYGYVGYGPPAPRAYGALGVAPGPGFVWIDGYYGYRGGRYEWMPGRWERPPRAGARWVRPEWRHENRGWRFHEGHWR
jgi:WXXGXW repeat (2 copies)